MTTGSPFKGIESALSTLREVRQKDASPTRAVLGGGTLQTLTEHNVNGMEHAINDLHTSVQSLNQDPAIANVLERIKEAASESRSRLNTVVKAMGSSNKYEGLMNDWQSAIKDNPLFERYEMISREISRRMERDLPRLPNTPEALLKRYQDNVESGAEYSLGIPSRRSLNGELLDTIYSKLTSFAPHVQEAINQYQRDEFRNQLNSNQNHPSPE